VKVGGVTSTVQVTVLDIDDVLLQASLAVNVLVCERSQLVLTTEPSDEVMVIAPQPSVPVAVPREAAGLPGCILMQLLYNCGKGWRSITSVHVTVLDIDDVLLQASLAVNVLVCERSQPVLTIEPSDEVIVTAPQPSVAVAVPSEPEGLAGLHPNATVV
jgi:hypothetical protein